MHFEEHSQQQKLSYFKEVDFVLFFIDLRFVLTIWTHTFPQDFF